MTAQLRIRPESYPGVELVLDLGSVVPNNPSDTGIADWNEIQRPRRRGMLEYKGEKLLKLELSVWLDAFDEGGNVEGTIRQIYGLAARVGLPFQPSILRLSGPVPYPDLPYVLTGIEEDTEKVERRNDGNRMRSELKLIFTEYSAPDLVVQGAPASPAAAAEERQQAKAQANPLSNVGAGVSAAINSSKTVTVKRGDTLSAIAARELKKANRWPEIAKLNGLRDPNKLQIGQVLRMPA